jgi:uncharacterized protein
VSRAAIRRSRSLVPEGMSSKVEVVQQFYAAFARGDIPAAFALLHPEVEFHEQPSLPWGKVYRGLAGMQEYLGEMTKWVGNDVRVTVHYVLDAPGDKVVARADLHALDRTFPFLEEWHVVEGRGRRIEPFLDSGMLMARLSELDKL